MVNIDIFVEEEYHQQFKELYEEHFKTQLDSKLSKFGLKEGMIAAVLVGGAVIVIVLLDKAYTERLSNYFYVESFFIYLAAFLLVAHVVIVSYLVLIFQLLQARRD